MPALCLQRREAELALATKRAEQHKAAISAHADKENQWKVGCSTLPQQYNIIAVHYMGQALRQKVLSLLQTLLENAT